jgi:uncharacterized protein YdhG (YjbR/CyaY superfamily)
MTTSRPENINDYIAGFPEHTQKMLQEIRALIKKLVPKAEETISYGIPSFTLDGHYLIYFAGYKKHIGVYPVPVGNPEFEKKFSKYKTSGKGAIQFPLDRPIPQELVSEIVKFRVKMNLEKTKKK